MKNIRKFFAILLVIALLSVPVSGLLAVMPLIPLPGGALPKGYKSYSGVITEVTKAGDTIVMIELADESLVSFLVTTDTYVFEGVSLSPGQSIKGFYDISLPAPAIFPPRYAAAVISGVSAIGNVFVGIFDENMLSSDKELKLNVADSTIIVDKAGKAFTGELAGSRLAVVYAIMTLSLPPQTTPSKIVVLEAAEAEDVAPVATPAPMTPEVPVAAPAESAKPDVSKMAISVDGKVINAPPAYYNADGLIMVPVRAIAEALGFTVHWDEAARMVVLNNFITFEPGKDYYTYARMAPFTLGAAPELKDGRTYVPLKLFTEVARFKSASVSDGQIVILSK